MLGYIFRGEKLSYKVVGIGALIFAALASVNEAGKSYLFKVLMDRVTGGNEYTLGSLVGLSVLFLLGSAIVYYCKDYFLAKVSAKIRLSLREDLLKGVFKESLSKTISSVEGIGMFNNDIELLIGSYYKQVLRSINVVTSLILGTYLIFRISYIMIITILAFTVPLILITKYMKEPISLSQKRTLDSLEEVIKKIKNYLSNPVMLKTLNLEGFVEKNFKDSNKGHSSSVRKKDNLNNYLNTINYLLGFGLFIAIYIVGVYLILKGSMSVGDLIFTIQTANVVVAPIFVVAPIYSEISSTNEIRKKLKRYLNRDEKHIKIDKVEDIVIDNLAYSYGDKSVLKNLSLKLKSGKRYLLLGESGSGKSTLMKILTKQVYGYNGSISIEGVELDSIEERSYFNSVGVLTQKPEYIDASIEDNIVANQEYDRVKLDNIIDKLGLREMVEALPHGTDTIIDSERLNISGGQLQRIAIARLLYSSAKVLFLDEPYSALDDENIEKIERALIESGKGMVVITHKVSEDTRSYYEEPIYLRALEERVA